MWIKLRIMTLTTVQGLIAMSMKRPIEPLSVESLLPRGIKTEGTGIRWAEWVDAIKVLGERDEGSVVTTWAFFMGAEAYTEFDVSGSELPELNAVDRPFCCLWGVPKFMVSDISI